MRNGQRGEVHLLDVRDRPRRGGKIAARVARGAEGVQLRVLSHKTTASLVSFGPSPDQHFGKSLKLAVGILPARRSIRVGEGLKFAAAMTVDSEGEMGRIGEDVIKAASCLNIEGCQSQQDRGKSASRH